jgi:hypothetical protein
MVELNPRDNKLPTTKTTAPVILGCFPVRHQVQIAPRTVA